MGANSKWNTADDILLKDAVESGATLEYLSKESLRFSQRYSVKELQDRWLSLLYDPIVSVKTSALMFEYERFPFKSQAKSSKDTKSLSRKRKTESLRSRYYSMRKMMSNVSQTVDHLDVNEPPFTDYILPDISATANDAMEGISAPNLPVVADGGKEDYMNDPFRSSNVNFNEQIPSLGQETATAGIIARLNQFMDCPDPDDVPDSFDEFYIGALSNLLGGYPNEHEVEIACPSADRGVVYCPAEKLLSSAFSVNPDFPELRNGYICCKLNTEDRVVPDNDNVFLPVRTGTPSPSCMDDRGFDKARNPVSSSIMDIPTHQRAGISMMKKQRSDNENLLMGSSFSTHRSMLMVKREETNISPQLMNSSFQPISVHDGNLKCTNENGNDKEGLSSLNQILGSSSVVDVKPQKENSDVLCNELSPNELESIEMLASELENELLENEECPEVDDDEDDVPYTSDVEAMILNMDFTPIDVDEDLSETVLRRPDEILIRTMIRLEQAARASSHRMMQASGAFAVLYSHRTIHLIKKPEVLLGRNAEDFQVDIDLSRERCKNKVSRRQAIIKVNDDESFHLRNLGKSSIYVNGVEVAQRQSQYLSASCLIEVRNAALLFETNPARVKRYLEEIRRGSKVPKQEPFCL